MPENQFGAPRIARLISGGPVKQPVLGLVASAIGIVLALAFISRFSLPAFNGPVAFHLLCAIPFQVMAVVIWGANPSFVAKLSQQGKGMALLLLNLVAVAIIAPLALMVVGQGINPPGPVPSHFAIIVVPTTFWLAIMWGGWPFNLFGRIPVSGWRSSWPPMSSRGSASVSSSITTSCRARRRR
jgi:hypothetical protein